MRKTIPSLSAFSAMSCLRTLPMFMKKEIKTSVSSKTLEYICTYRTISIGCPEGYDDCGYVPPRTISECNWTETGDSGPPLMQLCPPMECGGGGGGAGPDPGFEYPEPPQDNQNIINDLEGYPCAQNLVKQLPTLKNDLASSMQEIFQNNINYNITFKPKSGLGSVDGTTHTTYSSEFGTFKAIININDQILSNATKEYILVTMYHEVVHAFLGYELFRLGSVAFHEQYIGVVVGYDYGPDGNIINKFTFLPGHQQVGAFLGTLENILSSYNPSLPSATVKAMAKAGITTMTPEEEQLNNNERNTLLGNHQGTKCP